MLEKIAMRCSDRVKLVHAMVFPWESIIAIIISLIQECFDQEEAMKTACVEPSRFQMFMLHRFCLTAAGRTFSGRQRRCAANALADSVIETASMMSDEEISEVFREAQQRG